MFILRDLLRPLQNHFSDTDLGGCPRIRYSNDYLLMGFRKNLNYPDAKLQFDQILHSFFAKTRSYRTYPVYFYLYRRVYSEISKLRTD